MNSVILIGRITKDIELKYLNNQEQTALAQITLAVDRFKNNEADFPRIKIFGKQAENLERFCRKGSRIGIQGRIQTGSYDKNGQTVYTTDIIADRVEFLDFKPKEDADDSKRRVQTVRSGCYVLGERRGQE